MVLTKDLPTLPVNFGTVTFTSPSSPVVHSKSRRCGTYCKNSSTVGSGFLVVFFRKDFPQGDVREEYRDEDPDDQ